MQAGPGWAAEDVIIGHANEKPLKRFGYSSAVANTHLKVGVNERSAKHIRKARGFCFQRPKFSAVSRYPCAPDYSVPSCKIFPLLAGRTVGNTPEQARCASRFQIEGAQ